MSNDAAVEDYILEETNIKEWPDPVYRFRIKGNPKLTGLYRIGKLGQQKPNQWALPLIDDAGHVVEWLTLSSDKEYAPVIASGDG